MTEIGVGWADSASIDCNAVDAHATFLLDALGLQIEAPGPSGTRRRYAYALDGKLLGVLGDITTDPTASEPEMTEKVLYLGQRRVAPCVRVVVASGGRRVEAGSRGCRDLLMERRTA